MKEEILKEKKTKPNIGMYLKRFKGVISVYILLTLISCACDIFLTIILANTIEIITQNLFQKAILYLLIIIGISIVQRLCWYFNNLVYFKYSNKIMSLLNLDLAKQAFKLNSKTYNDHDTGTFVQRIVEDPAQIVDNLANLVDMIMSIITAFIMLVYITTLNAWISLALVVLGVVAGVIEYKRVKVRRKNRWAVRLKNDKVNSLTTEIVRSEKDIKSLGLEEKLSEVSKSYYEDYRNKRYKMDIVDCNFWSTRNFIISIGSFAVLLLGVYLMDKGCSLWHHL